MMNNKNEKKASKTVAFAINKELAVQTTMLFNREEFNDEQVECMARLQFAIEQDDRFFERKDIINCVVTNVELYGKKLSFVKYKDWLVDEEEMTVLSNYMILQLIGSEARPVGIVGVTSNVTNLYEPFQSHFLSHYEGVKPCTTRDLAEFMILSPRIRNYVNTSRNNMLVWKTVLRTEDGMEFSLDDLTEEQQMALGEAVINSEYGGF